MSESIVIIDVSEISEGKLEEVKAAMNELAEFAEANEPNTIAYNVYLNEDSSQVTVFQVHPDSASAEFHMNVAGPAFRKFTELLQLLRIDIYGKPSQELLERLRQKAQLLGSETVAVHELHAGFARFGVR
ncbi:MAG TPA: hypothetical protein VE439_08295 [Anaerolineae bacterium]|nr:hypothetical protein [Anaerolineae bacterium]